MPARVILLVLAGEAALAGWALGHGWLTTVLPGLIAMNTVTAICFNLLATVRVCYRTLASRLGRYRSGLECSNASCASGRAWPPGSRSSPTIAQP